MRPRSRADCSRRSGGLLLLAFAGFGPLRLDGVALGVAVIAPAVIVGAIGRGSSRRQLDDVVVLEQVADDGGGGGLAGDGRGEHHAA